MTTAQPSPGAAHPGPAAEHESQAATPPAAAKTPARLQQAAAGMAGSASLEGAADRKGLAQARERATPTGEGRGQLRQLAPRRYCGVRRNEVCVG
jgi:hypothetical protein